MIDIKLSLLEHQLQSIEGLNVNIDTTTPAAANEPVVDNDSNANVTDMNESRNGINSNPNDEGGSSGGQNQDDEEKEGKFVKNKDSPMYKKFFKMLAMENMKLVVCGSLLHCQPGLCQWFAVVIVL